jgi:mannitol/fructose-specific phosphotransferase system IIA component (Ntr-type)
MNKDEFRERLINSNSKKEIINIFKEEEEDYFDV